MPTASPVPCVLNNPEAADKRTTHLDWLLGHVGTSVDPVAGAFGQRAAGDVGEHDEEGSAMPMPCLLVVRLRRAEKHTNSNKRHTAKQSETGRPKASRGASFWLVFRCVVRSDPPAFCAHAHAHAARGSIGPLLRLRRPSRIRDADAMRGEREERSPTVWIGFLPA